MHNVRCQTEQAGRLRLAHDELAQGDKRGSRIFRKRTQGRNRLCDKNSIGGRPRPGNITKPFDRVHNADDTWVRRSCASATVSAVAALDGDPELDPTNGDARPFSEWLTTFPMLVGVIDPYTHESSWLLETISRIFHHYRGAGVRVAWLAAAPADGVKSFLGPYADEFLTFADPDRVAVKALGLTTLPALALVKQDGTIAELAEGWDPAAWTSVSKALEALTDWTPITIPGPKDPAPYAGTPARLS